MGVASITYASVEMQLLVRGERVEKSPHCLARDAADETMRARDKGTEPAREEWERGREGERKRLGWLALLTKMRTTHKRAGGARTSESGGATRACRPCPPIRLEPLHRSRIYFGRNLCRS